MPQLYGAEGAGVFVLLLLLLLLLLSRAAGLTTDGLSLLALKLAVSEDPTDALSGWRDTDATPCAWPGVTCHDGRIAALALPDRALVGYLPSELSLLTSLEVLSLPGNRFAGPIPSALAELGSLASLDLSRNRLSGPIPPEIAGMSSLSHLDLSSNFLNGTLPPAIAELPHISGVLNLSCNLLSGSIPSAFGSVPVSVSLDLRLNNLTGEIPQVGSLLNQGPTAFAGNPGLCGFPLKNPCPGPKQDPKLPEPNSNLTANPTSGGRVAGQRRGKLVATIVILAGIIVAALVSILALQWQFRRRRAVSANGKAIKEKGGSPVGLAWDQRREGHASEIFAAVDEGFGLEMEELLRASAYVVGKSRSGIVYKVVVGRGSTVAVRRLSETDEEDGDGGATVSAGDEWRRRRAFESEAIAIGRAKHPNVVRLLAYYYAPDERLLIYDYVSNGTLHATLHGGPLNPTPPALPWAARLAIVQGVARGLAYIHDCSPRKYAHGSIRSTKILLDDDLQPYISGFGVARLIAGTQKLTHSSSKKLGASHAAGSRGSGGAAQAGGVAGYLAPELRQGQGAAPPTPTPTPTPTQRGDVYAFGVLAMEAVTGRPAEAELEGCVRAAFKEERPLSEVVDPALLHEVHAKKEVLAVFHVALGCTEPDPEMRPRMRAVVESLDRIGVSPPS